ncbi:MAG: ester cyclase [Gammaproteobacteria bacterium]
MSPEENKALYRRFITEVANRGNMTAADEILAPNITEHEKLPPGVPANRDGIKQLFAMIRKAFPDLCITIEDQIAEADKVVARVTLRGTHQGEFFGISPTGRRVAYGAIDISRMAGGQLVEHWGIPDYLSLLQQLGAVPAPGQDR